MSKPLNGLVLSSVCSLASLSVGAIYSIALNLPARFGGVLSGNDVLHNFLLINGTALGQPGEPITTSAFNPARIDALQTGLVTINIVTSVLMVVFGLLEFRSRTRPEGAQSS